MSSPRVGLAAVLILGAAVLLSAVEVGNHVGSRVLGQFAREQEVVPTPLFTPVAEQTGSKAGVQWKHAQVISVATDPAFPDPRVTPVPPPRPVPRVEEDDQVTVPASTPARIRSSSSAEEAGHARYTSPPLPLPLATHEVNYPDY